MTIRRAALALLIVLVGCAPKPPKRPAPLTDADSLGSVSDAYWEELVRHAPVWATATGDRSRDAEIDDPSPAEHDRHAAALARIAARVEKIDRAKLTAGQRITREFLAADLAARASSENACRFDLWKVDQLAGPQVTLMQLSTWQTIQTRAQAADLLARYRKIGGYFEAHIAALRVGLGKGLVAPKSSVDRVVKQLEGQLAKRARELPLFIAAEKLPADWTAEEKARVEGELLAAVESSVIPGLRTYHAFLRNEVAPRARTAPGVSALPGGDACYRAQVRRETGTALTAEEIHDMGLLELKSIETEMDALVKKEGLKDRAALLASLDRDPAQFVKTREELIAHNEKVIARATAALPRAFGRLPKIPMVVRAYEPYRERDASRGSYENAPADGSRPAVYYLNTYQPEKRPLYEMAALAFHEAVPGHHLQVALAGEMKDVPRFQRELGQNAFVEGWGLYSERLADELGLYTTTGERFGMLDAQRIRAVRLVVDTGLHAKGWSRERAVEFQLAHTAGNRESAERAIDRYITWPGQALGYMVGQIEIRRLRADTERKLGPTFDLKAFHDRLLSNGGVPLSVARRDLETWAAGVAKQ